MGLVTDLKPRHHTSGQFIFRYNGVFDWNHVYKECKKFWLRIVSSEWDVKEKLYKNKPSKLEVRWDVYHNYDAYYQIVYNVTFKGINPKKVIIEQDGVKKEMMQCNIRMWIKFGWVEEYNDPGFAGDKRLFQGTWLKSIYRKVTWRERWDLVDDIGMFTATEFMDLTKKLFNMEAAGYGSIYEGG